VKPAQIHAAIDGAFALLPEKMRSHDARVLMISIGLQESRFEHRRQIQGPARGYWQFELAGIRGVLNHHTTRTAIREVLLALDYDDDAGTSYTAVEHNDVLAAAYARCLLWTVPRPLPDHSVGTWYYYLDAWRPGKPHPQTWQDCFEHARGLCV
jgi:hypothetical protein